MDALVKTIVDAGIGIVAIAGLIFVIIQQLQIIRQLTQTLDNNTVSTNKNTEVLGGLKDMITKVCDTLNAK
jgi:hypothetical protein